MTVFSEDNMKIKDIAINFHPNDRASLPLLKELLDFIHTHKISAHLPDYGILRENGLEKYISPPDEFVSRADLIIAIGGDGTFLRTARMFSDSSQPIFGINRGRLGFLTEFNPEEYKPYLEQVLQGNISITERISLEARLIKKNGESIDLCFINDAVISRGALSRAITIEIEVDGLFLNSYAGDGLIVSTPTGSTAYSLSAGGPIITPVSTNVLLLTPICPHTLGMRPMILPVTSVLRAKIVSEERNLVLTIDGQDAYNVSGEDVIQFNRSEKKIYLITHPDKNFYAILREKLGWG